MDDRRKEDVIIFNLSRTGLQFGMESTASFSSGDRAVIEFTLDDSNKTSIVKEIVIKKAQPPLFGAAFSSVETGDVYDQAIAHYLFGLAIPLWEVEPQKLRA